MNKTLLSLFFIMMLIIPSLSISAIDEELPIIKRVSMYPINAPLFSPSSKWLIGADQMQVNDSGYGAPHERSREFAQEFIPTKPTLTAVALYFIRVGHPHEETTITVSIRDDLDGPDLTVITLLAWDYRIKDFPPYTWVLFDFPDISVTPGHTYYIHETVSHQEYFTNSYGWGFGINNPYSKGNSWGKDLDIFDWKTLWEANGFDPKIPDPDFNFITYHQEPKAKTSHHPFLIFLEQHPHLFPFLRSLIGL